MKLRSALRRLSVTVPFFATAALILMASEHPTDLGVPNPGLDTAGPLLRAERPQAIPADYRVEVMPFFSLPKHAGPLLVRPATTDQDPMPVEMLLSRIAAPGLDPDFVRRVGATAYVNSARVRPAP